MNRKRDNDATPRSNTGIITSLRRHLHGRRLARKARRIEEERLRALHRRAETNRKMFLDD